MWSSWASQFCSSFSPICSSLLPSWGSPQERGGKRPSPPALPTSQWWPSSTGPSSSRMGSPNPRTPWGQTNRTLQTSSPPSPMGCWPPCSTPSSTAWGTRTWRLLWGTWWVRNASPGDGGGVLLVPAPWCLSPEGLKSIRWRDKFMQVSIGKFNYTEPQELCVNRKQSVRIFPSIYRQLYKSILLLI